MTDYIVADKASVLHIHKRLCSVCGSAAVDRSTVCRWVKRVTASETGKAEIHDQPRSGHSVGTVSPERLQDANAIVRED